MATVAPPPEVELNSDIELYDLDTGEHRRVTTRESTLRVHGIHFPYALMGFWIATYYIDYYVANLLTLGLVDESGHLILGEPVLEPPDLPAP